MIENEKENHKCTSIFCCGFHPQKVFKFLMILVILSGFALCALFVAYFKQEIAPKYITVVGISNISTQNKIASYSATMTFRDVDKRIALTEVRKLNDTFINKLRTFGIDEGDIKTTSENTYQEIIYKDGVRNSLGSWISSISTTFKLRDVTKTDLVPEILSDPSIESSWGPDFSTDSADVDDAALLKSAVDSAYEKAVILSTKLGQKLLEPVNIVEGYTSGMPIMFGKAGAEGMGGAGGIAPGETETTKIVTVTYRVR